MLSGVKIIPRDQIDERRGESSDSAAEGRRRSGHRKEKYSKEKKGSRYESSDDEELQQIKKAPRRKKWYSSEEYSSSRSSGSSDDDSQRDERKCYDRKKKKKKKKIDAKELDGGSKSRKKKSRSGRKTSEDFSSSSSGSEKSDSFEGDARKEKHRKGSKKDGQKKGKGGAEQNTVEGDFDDQKIVRKEMGLEWMLRPEQRTERSPAISVDKEPLDNANEEATKENPRELNPYLKDNGSGYPEEDGLKSGGERRVHSSVIGDGGASWRLKALKRAKEQAARDGRNIEEVVAERWGSLGHLAVSAASHRAAPSRAHLDSIRNRKRGLMEEQQIAGENEEDGNTKKNARNYLKDVSLRNPDMRVPKVDDSLSWRKRRGQNPSSRDADAELISAAMSNLNKFSNDGSFMQAALGQRRNISGDSSSSQPAHGRKVNLLEEDKPHEAITQVNEGLSANQLAAKALQLRMKGKHEEADKLLQEVENLRNKQLTSDSSHKSQNEGGTNRNVLYDVSHQRKKEEDADRHLAKTIMQNRRFSTSGQADDEYDFDGPPRKRTQKKGASNDQKATQSSALAKRILTQQERCFYCFENPKRPRHLVVSIANFTYLMLPMQQPVVPGHCCIVTMQHESSTRTVDDNVWEEIRNFKKCLIMMFAKQEKDLVFLETVMGLARQQRHCLIECLPLPREVAGDAPLYFKKAIDEAEDEWSQHNAKKLIDTSVKGLRASIPKDFPYFHVEFGLNKGFVHVIDDEKDFKSSLGLNVIRGMMRLPEEDMHRRRRSESEDTQRRAAASFMQDWEPFDWTKQLD